jgi:hypothetical protein
MLVVQYKHPLHGLQTIKCPNLINKDGIIHARNIHGVTFQTLEPSRILTVELIEELRMHTKEQLTLQRGNYKSLDGKNLTMNYEEKDGFARLIGTDEEDTRFVLAEVPLVYNNQAIRY